MTDKKQYVTRREIIGALEQVKGVSVIELGATALYYQIGRNFMDTLNPFSREYNYMDLSESICLYGDRPQDIRVGRVFLVSRKIFSENPRNKRDLAKKIFTEVKRNLPNQLVFSEDYGHQTEFPFNPHKERVVPNIKRSCLTYLEKVGEYDCQTNKAIIDRIENIRCRFLEFQDPLLREKMQEEKLPIVIPSTIMVS